VPREQHRVQGLSDIAADDVVALDDVREEFSKRSPS
jgi:hypothetical protein